MIDVKHLSKSFGDHLVLDDISEHIHPQEKVVIIGPSGSGKSTFLRCLNLLETPTKGSITFDGTEITDPKVDINLVRRQMGMVFQHFNLFPNMTIRKNITLAPVQTGLMKQAEADETASTLLRRVGLEDKADSYPAQLSGGQKQRVAIARMLMQQAPVMIFDDSLSAVDAETDEKIRTALRRSTGNATVLLISHRVTTLMQADRILVLDGGRVAELGTHAQLVEKPGIYRDIYHIQMQSADRALLEEGGSEHGGH
mgnify:CR=1 FL=1